MAEGKNPVFSELEQSLINFLCSKKEVEEKVSGGTRRVRSLTFNVDVKDPKKACFTIQIGMCEAAFNANTGLKEKGSCFGLERFIRDWYERPSVKSAIVTYIEAQDKK
ncbi:hypothetical protein IJ182_05255 [bacterium]|nr:hypothetical protein [bacterium]